MDNPSLPLYAELSKLKNSPAIDSANQELKVSGRHKSSA